MLRFVGRSVGALVLTSVLAHGAVAQGNLPRAASIATNPQGSLFYSVGSAFAKVLSGALPTNVNVRPFTGPTLFIPMLHGGELAFGLNNLVDAHMYYNGTKPWPQFEGVRLVTPVFRLYSTMIVPGNSDIKSIADAKGKRVAADFRAHLISRFSSQALLASAGLKFKDFRPVPVASHSHGVRALMEGRVDIAYGAVGPPVVREANAALPGGVRFLPVGGNHKAMQEFLPGVGVEKVRAGFFRGIIKEPTDLVTNDVYFVSGLKTSDELVYATTKAIWEKIADLKKAHRALRAKLSHKWMVQSVVTLPYHRAAIRFFKEQGAWTDAADKNHRANLAKQNQPH